MSGEHSTDKRNSGAHALPLWGLFLCGAVIAWQLTEVNANLKAQNRVLAEQKQSLGSISGNLDQIEGGARLGAPHFQKALEGVRNELQLLREGQGKGGLPPKGDNP
jgi:hypothetical protein